MAKAFGPNDFNFEEGFLQPGLGSHEPDDVTKEQVLADSEANAKRQAALDRAAAVLATESDVLDRKAKDLEEKEAELVRRERALRQAEAGDDDAPVARRTAKQATERSS